MAASAALKGTEYTVKAVKLAGAHTTRAAKAVMQQSARIGKSAARFFDSVNQPKNTTDWGRYSVDRKLPRDKYGNAIPDVDRPHSQIGKSASRKGGAYTQAREWGFDQNGKIVIVKDIDFTDHGRPSNHPNPHEHKYFDNPTGGTRQRSKIAEPLCVIAPKSYQMNRFIP